MCWADSGKRPLLTWTLGTPLVAVAALLAPALAAALRPPAPAPSTAPSASLRAVACAGVATPDSTAAHSVKVVPTGSPEITLPNPTTALSMPWMTAPPPTTAPAAQSATVAHEPSRIAFPIATSTTPPKPRTKPCARGESSNLWIRLSVFPSGSTRFTGLFRTYEYRLRLWLLPGSGTTVSGWRNRPSRASYHLAP